MRDFASARQGGYAAAALLGAAFLWLQLPLDVLLGTGAVWLAPQADLAQNLGGHLAFQQEPWRWPPLLVRNMLWPGGVSIALTDSNPLFSVVAKLVAGIVGRPVNLFGLWFALCWLLQPVASVYAVRSMGATSLGAALAAAAIGLCFPALLARVGLENLGHINLLGHFLLLAGLGWSIRMVRGAGARWWQAALLATVAIFIHPFLFVLLCSLFAPPVIACVLARRGVAGAVAGFLASTALPYGLFAIVAGTTGGGDFGYGVFSMNLASPFWPQLSGVFGSDLPVVDATQGQYEGFNYLGAGALLLLGVAVALLAARRRSVPHWRNWIGHALVLLALTGMAVSHKVYLGPWAIVAIDASIIDRVMGPVRASGRLFWPAGYMLALAPIAVLERRLSRPWLLAVLGIAVVLQWVDTQPLREKFRFYLAGGGGASDLVPLPPEATLLATATYCGPLGEVGVHVDRLRLAAVRAGLNLSDVRLSRSPPGMTCERMNSDALELGLRPGEVRGFVGDIAKASLRSELLGPDAACRESRDMLLCGAAGLVDGEKTRIGAPVPRLLPGHVIDGEALAPFLGWGWVGDERGGLWSKGSRAVLVFRMPEVPGATRRVRLVVEGIGRRKGDASRVQVAVGANRWPKSELAFVPADLADLTASGIDLDVPPDVGPGEIVRIVISIPAPVDPRVRGMAMPVRWAGIRLLGLAALP